ncbi:MAG TPA: PorP/SprF family type IX secretion system membrane protein [Puia sp.]|nr:PorP/SprF family type IX secretion system membrane protein [Puia sp.]
MKKPFLYKKYLATLIVLLAAIQFACSQDLHFSQFFEAPLLRNPSLAGIFTGDYRIQGVYRDQWNSFTNAYRTGSFNGEYKMPVGHTNDFLTVGMQILYDKAGTAGLTTTEIFPAVNYHKSLSNEKTMYLSLGFMGGYAEKRIDRSKITTNNQFQGGAYNPALPDGETFPTPSVHYWDGSVGMTFNETFGSDQQNSMFIGAAMHHLNRPKNSFYQDANTELDPKYVFSAGFKFTVNEVSYLTIQADHTRQGPSTETIGGAMYSYKLGEFTDDPKYVVNIGAFLRWQDAVIPVVKLDMMPLSIALSYDINISSLETVSQGRGGVELSISYIGFTEHDNSAKYKVLCPRF